MGLLGRLKDESGHQSGCLAIVIFSGVTSAILIPILLQSVNKIRSRECLESLANAANQGIEIEEARCLVPNLDIERQPLDGGEKYFYLHRR